MHGVDVALYSPHRQEMESHEERLAEMIKQSKMNEAKVRVRLSLRVDRDSSPTWPVHFREIACWLPRGWLPLRGCPTVAV